MNKKRSILIIGVSLIVILVAVGFFTRSQANHYQDNHTIATGELRKTTFSLVSSAENSTTDYQKQYSYIEDIGDNRGYTAGIIGFTSATGDLRKVILKYQELRPKNALVKYLPALKANEGSASHAGLGKDFEMAWKKAANDSKMIQAQNYVLNQQYLKPALKAAKEDNLGPLGQYIYYDAIVVHGPGNDAKSFGGIRKKAKSLDKAARFNQSAYLLVFLKTRSKVMRQEQAHQDLSRINTQVQFLKEKNLQLTRPLSWKMYGDSYHLSK